MQYTSDQTNVIISAVRIAEAHIRVKAGLDVRLEVKQMVARDLTVEELMCIVADCLNRKVEDYKRVSRAHEYVNLRRQGAWHIKQHLPGTSSKEIGRLFGGYDHTTILNLINTAENLINTGNPNFCKDKKIIDIAIKEWFEFR